MVPYSDKKADEDTTTTQGQRKNTDDDPAKQVKHTSHKISYHNTDRVANRDNLLRGRAAAHAKDIICGDLAMHLDLIATGGRDRKVRIWDYERI